MGSGETNKRSRRAAHSNRATNGAVSADDPVVRVRSTGPLVADLMEFMRRFLIITDSQLLVIALWVIHTYLTEHVEQTPYLSITSPNAQCGKSRLLEVLELLTWNSWMVIQPSDAVAYRYIDSATPTLLLDEVDTIFSPKSARFHEGLRAIIDAGHRRGAKVPRAKDFGKGVEHFSPFCAKALAGIGSLPDTIAGRSIYIRLERKRKDEKVDKLIRRDVAPQADALREQVFAWAQEHGEEVGRSRPAMPEQLSDRMEEGCESLVAIAELCGCGDEVRAALVELLAGERLDVQQTMRVRLLRDLWAIWKTREERKGKIIRGIPTASLLVELHAIEDAPWSTYYGKRDGLDANDMASLLRPYEIHPKDIKVSKKENKVLKGYRRDDLYPVFERYAE